MEIIKRGVESPATQFAGTTLAALAGTAIYNHRVLTHRSLEPKAATAKALDVMQAPYAQSREWACAHRVHHSTADTNFVPALEYADLMDWLDSNPDVKAQYGTPETLHGFDPFMPEMTHQEVMEVGGLARELVVGKYKPAETYSDEDIRRILFDDQPRYLYEEPKGHKKKLQKIEGEASLWDIRFLLRDPHSPALHPRGIPGIAFNNKALYEDAANFFKLNPQFRPDDLANRPFDDFVDRNIGKIRGGLLLGHMAARVAIDRPKTGKEFATSAAKGAVIFGLGTAALIFGGNATNSLGHGGDLHPAEGETWRDNLKAIWRGRVRPQEDGTYMTDKKRYRGLFDAALGGPTLDEVGGQKEHHEHPEKIAYTSERGIAGAKDAPFGSMLKVMAENGILFEPGKGFEGRRPDEPTDAVLKVEELRRQRMQTA